MRVLIVRPSRQARSAVALIAVGAMVGGALFAPPALAGPGGTVRAHVTTSGGAPLNGICLDLLVPGGKNSAPDLVVETAPSDLSGFITQANVAAGSYNGLFRDCGNLDPNYVSRFAGSAFDQSKARLISVTDGGTVSLGVTPIDLGATVSGTLTDPVSLGGAVNVSVTAWTASGHLIAEDYANPACTDGSGQWTIPALPTSGVKFEFAQAPFFECGGDLPYKDQFFNGATTYAGASVVSLSPDGSADASQQLTRAYGTTPAIDSIVTTGSVDNPTITVHGHRFGSAPAGHATVCPTPTGDDGQVFARGSLFLADDTGGWGAGFGGDCIGLIIGSYTATTIVFTLGAWYQQDGQPEGINLSSGDSISLTVKGTTANSIVNYGPFSD